jgi:WASH complex subunit strumpellin
LLRRQIASVIQFGCQLEAHLLYQALDTFNRALLNDIRIHALNPEHPAPPENNPLLFEMNILLESCGLDDPLDKVYITSQPLEGLPVLLFLFILAYLPKVSVD